MQAIQEEKKELERLREEVPKQGLAAVAVGSSGSRGSRFAPLDRMATGMDKGGDSRGSVLRLGTRCRYESATYGWMPAIVKGYNESDGTYNLDVKPHVPADKIAPPGDVAAAEAWPAGAMASYLSSSVDRWLPALVVSFNDGDGTYNLDVRDHADIDRIRARSLGDATASRTDSRRGTVDRQAGQGKQEATQLGQQAAALMTQQRSRPSREEDGSREGADNKKAPYRLSDLEATACRPPADPSAPSAPPRWVNKGDVCFVREHGLVFIQSSVGRDGCYTVKVDDKKQFAVATESMRAPKDAKFAWAPGTQVSYLSASVGKWIDAQVLSFNSANGTYNLDVRPEANPDNVRPR